MNSFLKGEFISDLYFFLKNEVCLYAVSVSLCPETFQRENVLQGFAQGSDMVPCIFFFFWSHVLIQLETALWMEERRIRRGSERPVKRLSAVDGSVCFSVCIFLYIHFVLLHAKSLQLCPTLCDPMDCIQLTRLLCP